MADKKNTDFDLSADGTSAAPSRDADENTNPHMSGEVQDQPQDKGDKKTGTRSGAAGGKSTPETKGTEDDKKK